MQRSLERITLVGTNIEGIYDAAVTAGTTQRGCSFNLPHANRPYVSEAFIVTITGFIDSSNIAAIPTRLSLSLRLRSSVDEESAEYDGMGRRVRFALFRRRIAPEVCLKILSEFFGSPANSRPCKIRFSKHALCGMRKNQFLAPRVGDPIAHTRSPRASKRIV